MSSAFRPGWYGEFGGRFVPDTLIPALRELEAAFEAAQRDPAFQAELGRYLRDYGGRPTPLYFAQRLTEHAGGARLLLKREDLCHGGAHKLNNVMGQGLLARRMGKQRIIAETGAGQHGVATAMAGAVLGIPTEVYMGSEDIRRQSLNVYRMRLLGATVHPVRSGSRTLKDAINEALRDWVTNVETTYYLLGSTVGPHPYPLMVREFQSVIGKELRSQMQSQEGALPDLIVACVGGGSNAAGAFAPFLEDQTVELLGVEAAGEGLRSGRHAASLVAGRPGILHGARSYLLQDRHGQVAQTHSIAAGLDYPGVGPEHAYWKEQGRVKYEAVGDREALRAFRLLSELEGIMPALEPAHAIAAAAKRARRMPMGARIAVILSGRGDKDIRTVAAAQGVRL